MLTNKLRAGYPGLYLVTHEEQRAEAMIAAGIEKLNAVAGVSDPGANHQPGSQNPATAWQLHCWSVTTGRFNTDGTESAPDDDPMSVLDAVAKMPEQSVLILKDYHLFLAEPNPLIYRKLKDTLLYAKTASKTLIILAPVLKLPPELEKFFAVIEFALPEKPQLQEVLERICQRNELDMPAEFALDNALAAASGLTTNEAEDAFALSIIECGSIDASVVAREKAETIRKNGILEIVHTPETLDSIGGFNVAKPWLVKRRNAFGHAAAAYQLPSPKGVCVVGISGTGKSLFSKVTASVFGVPLVKLDAGRIFGGHVGESEANLRAVIQTAEAIAPCVLWIDEIEKGFSGSKSSGSTDGGTSARVFGSFLQWMQDKKKPVFVVATANDVSALPPEFLRKGRFDEVFFVDLPTQAERKDIWKIQITKHGRDWHRFPIDTLGSMTDGYTGAEIEAVFEEALYLAFDEDREPKESDVSAVLKEFVPLSKMMADDITRLQNWAKGRARRASAAAPTVVKAGRKLAG